MHTRSLEAEHVWNVDFYIKVRKCITRLLRIG